MFTAKPATPASQVKTCSTGSRPKATNAISSSAAVMVCSNDETWGDSNRGCTRATALGSDPASDMECWYRASTLWKDRTQAKRLVISSTFTTWAPELPRYSLLSTMMKSPRWSGSQVGNRSGPAAMISAHWENV
jgi:hypothetical protein